MFYRLVCWEPDDDGEGAEVVTWMETANENTCVAFGSVYADLSGPEVIVMIEKVE